MFTSGAAAEKVVLVVGEYLTTTMADTISIAASGERTIEMDDAPSHDSVTPTETTMVSLFQTNSIATRGVIYANWSLSGPADTGGNKAVVEMVRDSLTGRVEYR